MKTHFRSDNLDKHPEKILNNIFLVDFWGNSLFESENRLVLELVKLAVR